MTDEAVVRIRPPMTTICRWSARLARPIVLEDGTRLVTLGDVRMFILKQSEHTQDRSSWHQAAELVILARKVQMSQNGLPKCPDKVGDETRKRPKGELLLSEAPLAKAILRRTQAGEG